MRALVTGGAGFIGSNLVKHLCDGGHEVVVIDDLSSSGRSEIDPRAKLVVGDVGDRELVEKLLDKKDVVFHLAALGIISISLEKPEEAFRNNLMNGVRLLEAMRKKGVNKIVYSSSSSIYGEPKRNPVQEDDSKEPINPYGASKYTFEAALSAYAHSFGIGAIALRYFNVYGPGDEQKPVTRAVPSWIQWALTGDTVWIHWGGQQVKDYIYVDDVCRANIVAANSKLKGFHAYNVGGGVGRKMLDIAMTIKKIIGKDLKIVDKGARPGDPDTLVADISKITKELGWKPEVDLETGLKKTIEYYKERLKK
ncbi:MAG: NAD-dependent epimerase/dehydratase [Parcubacteria group bacterium GW2011_GWA2_47_8b]|nr:MAG: NAD-dependent epimerase/dehydratase [Parcubacteria group bacterium GW2011_GWA2_47_8b]